MTREIPPDLRTAMRARLPAAAPKIRDDGRSRTDQQQAEIDLLFTKCFKGRTGDLLLRYLRSITVDDVAGPGIDDCALRHREGSRYLFAIIERAVKRGRG